MAARGVSGSTRPRDTRPRARYSNLAPVVLMHLGLASDNHMQVNKSGWFLSITYFTFNFYIFMYLNPPNETCFTTEYQRYLRFVGVFSWAIDLGPVNQSAETCPTIVAVGGSMDGMSHFCLGHGPLFDGPSLARQKVSLFLEPRNSCNDVIKI